MRSLIKKIIYGYRIFKIKLMCPNLTHGERMVLASQCSASKKNKITIGNDFFMGRNCHLASNLNIGNNVMFASYVACVGGDHKIDYITTTINKSGRDTLKTTIIKDNVWVGHGVTIMHGIKISSGAVIAAGAVVTKNVPENAIFGGNPAKLIRYRKS